MAYVVVATSHLKQTRAAVVGMALWHRGWGRERGEREEEARATRLPWDGGRSSPPAPRCGFVRVLFFKSPPIPRHPNSSCASAAGREPPPPKASAAARGRHTPEGHLVRGGRGGGGSAPTPLCGTAVWGERKAPPSTAVAATLQSQSCCCSQQTAGWWPAGFELGAPPYGLSPPEPTPGACIRPPDLCGRLRWPYCQSWAKTPTTLTTPPPESPTLAGLPRMARRRCHGWPASHVGTMGEARVSARDGWEDTPAGVCHFPPPFSKWPSCTARRTQGQRGGGW